MNIELYIANKICDLEKSDLSIRLKRQFINPTQMSTKDAQKSYTITLPSTPANDAIFKYANVEEVQGKFSIYPDAKLYVNGILILDGKFRLSEIARDGYKGNLGVPAAPTVKDIFGEKKMNEAGEWKIPYIGEESITDYNMRKDSPECIFPFVLYGLMNKTQMKDKETIDGSTRFAIQDFPPSVNCVQMLKKIFENTTKDGQRYSLSGTALDDKRLQNLYVSYRNPSDYPMPFTYGEVKISGKWTNVIDPSINRGIRETRMLANKHDHNTSYDFKFMACDILQSDNVRFKNIVDPTNILIRDGSHVTYKAPITGLYKIKLEVTTEMPATYYREGITDLSQTAYSLMGKDGGPKYPNLKRDFRNVACEVKLVRHTNDIYELSSATIDNEFRKINRNPSGPAYYPNLGAVHFVDPKKKDDILCGFSWGSLSYGNGDVNDPAAVEDYINPMVKIGDRKKGLHNPIAMKHGKSWYTSLETFQSCATYSPGYQKDESHTPIEDDKEIEKYVLKVDLENSSTFTRLDSTSKGYGTIEQMIHLDEGEKITLLSVMDMSASADWIHHTVDFDISIEPFRQEKNEEENSWLQMHNDGYSKAVMNYEDLANFLTNEIDLIKFLPSAVKIDEWINNFCKAFNLELQHTGKLNFELNAKDKQMTAPTSWLIDLDQKASVAKLVNNPFDLPKAYELAFTLNNKEEGYHTERKGNALEDNQLGGTGLYQAGNVGTDVTSQKSNFSYCWYKTLTDNKNLAGKELSVPVISDKEVWQDRNDYSSMMSKTYHDKPQRFWYHSHQTHPFYMGQNETEKRVEAALVSNTYSDGNLSMSLHYHNTPNSIARSYFMLLDNSKNYTTVECYLSPVEYDRLGKSLIKYNGDLYHLAEADGYDPLGRSKTKMKLIRKI